MERPTGRGPGRTRARSLDDAPARHGPPLFLQQIRIEDGEHPDEYPFTLPAVRGLRASGGLALDAPVTFLVGHNGSGKSTLLEAIAVAAGFNAEGGSVSFRFSTAATHSSLGDSLILRRGTRKPRSGYFLRAESFYNVASEIDRIEAEPGGAGLVAAYGGVSLHHRSHGESFLALLTHRFFANGLYLLDEPEAALSPQGVMAAIARIHELAQAGSQFVVATHSPMLLAVPDATILEIDDDGHVERVSYDAAMPVAITRGFLADPARHLRELLADDPPGSGSA